VIEPNHVNQDATRSTGCGGGGDPQAWRGIYASAAMWTRTVGRSPSRTSTTAAVNCSAAVNYTRFNSDHGFTTTCWKLVRPDLRTLLRRWLANEETEPMRVGFAAKTDATPVGPAPLGQIKLTHR
jgi:hypothetical protein